MNGSSWFGQVVHKDHAAAICIKWCTMMQADIIIWQW